MKQCKFWCLLLLMGAMAGEVVGQAGWFAARRGPAGKDLSTVYFADSKRGWIGGDDGFVSYTSDGGHSWSQQSLDTRDGVNDIYFRNKENGYLLVGNSVFKTEDGGRTWREARRFLPKEFDGATAELYSLRFSSKKKGWIIGSVSRNERVVDSLLIYTEDAGATWQRKIVPIHEELFHLDFTDDRRGWIVGTAGAILYTEDAGETWIAQRAGTNATLYGIAFRDSKTGWAVGGRGTILRTTDSGARWTKVSSPVKNTLLSVQFVDDERGWIVGRGGVILRSDDGGETWLQQESQTKQNLYALFIENKNGWAVGGDGIVLQYER